MKTILVADDNKNVREYCKRELEEEGYRVVLAHNGKEAVDVLERELPDLVILDIVMPVAGGLEAAERIKAIEPSLPVVLFTSYDEACLKDRRSELATACVEKDADLTELKRTIVRTLASPKAARSLGLGLPSASSSPQGSSRNVTGERPAAAGVPPERSLKHAGCDSEVGRADRPPQL